MGWVVVARAFVCTQEMGREVERMGIAVRRVCVHTTALDSAAGAGRLRGSRWPGLRCGGAKSHKALTAVQRTNSKTDETPCERKNHRANRQPKCRC